MNESTDLSLKIINTLNIFIEDFHSFLFKICSFYTKNITVLIFTFQINLPY